ncbi:MAG: carbon-nitrogen hydrolase family protein [Anaerolineaceae bacterium]|nr:carbon-nitrogen hydrolase family protein [Anaerolineaceae bacterium]
MTNTSTHPLAPHGKSLRVAFLHLAPRWDDVQYNLSLLETMIIKAAALKADLILTPELAVSGYEFYKVLGKEWIKTDVPGILQKFSKLARQNRVALLLGSPIYDQPGDRYYNAAVLIDENGQVTDAHHKIRVLPGAEDWSQPGQYVQPVEWSGRRIGIMICADASKESIAAELAAQGAEVLISLSAWAPGLHGPSGEWEQRSKDTGLCFLVCNRTGPGALVNFTGSSSVVAVAGRRLLEYANPQPAILTIDLDAHSWLPQSGAFTITC